jgi:mRNA interferase RelE/StbE
MKAEFSRRFYKDIDKISHLAVKSELLAVIQEVEEAKLLTDIRNIKKLKGHPIAYRIRIGDYKIDIFYEKNVVEFIGIVHRKDIYKVFP